MEHRTCTVLALCANWSQNKTTIFSIKIKIFMFFFLYYYKLIISLCSEHTGYISAIHTCGMFVDWFRQLDMHHYLIT